MADEDELRRRLDECAKVLNPVLDLSGLQLGPSIAEEAVVGYCLHSLMTLKLADTQLAGKDGSDLDGLKAICNVSCLLLLSKSLKMSYCTARRWSKTRP